MHFTGSDNRIKSALGTAPINGPKNGTTPASLDESAPSAVLVSTKRENAADYLRGITDADVYSTLESGAIIIRMADGHFTIEQFEEMQ